MPGTPGTARKSGRGRAAAELPEDLRAYTSEGEPLLVPRYVFPKEKAPKGFKGWKAFITGVDPAAYSDGLHVTVEFEGDPSLYHFAADEVRRWIGGATEPAEQQQEAAAPKSARKSARKASATSSRTPATARRRSAAAARTRAAEAKAEEAEEEEAESQGEGEAPRRAAGGASTPAKSPAKSPAKAAAAAAAAEAAAAEEEEDEEERPSTSRQRAERKRKHSDVGAAEGGGREKRHEDEAAHEEPGWLDKAADAARQAIYSGAAVGVAYGLLRTLYPALEAAAP